MKNQRLSRSLLIATLSAALLLVNFAARAADYYWKGGSGVWTDLTHWATSSGGSTNHTIVPTPLDNVIFDGNSFPSGGTVTISFQSFCNNLTVTSGVTTNPTFQFNNGLIMNGAINAAPTGTLTWNQNTALQAPGGITMSKVIFSMGSGTLSVANGGISLSNATQFTYNGGSTITLGTGATLVVDGTSKYTQNNGGLTTNGSIAVPAGANITLNNVGVNVNGTGNTVAVATGGVFYHYGSINVNGTVAVPASTTVTMGHLTVNGAGNTVTVASTGTFTQPGGYNFNVNGPVIIPSGATFNSPGGSKNIFDGSFHMQAGSVGNVYGDINIRNGSFKLDPAATVTNSASIRLFLNATSAATHQLQMGGRAIARMELNGNNVNAEYRLVDSLCALSDGLFPYVNKFYSDGNPINVYHFYNWNGNVCTIDVTGTDTIRVVGQFRMYPNTNTNFVIGNAVIKWLGTDHQYFIGGNKKYNDLVFVANNTSDQQISLEHNNNIRDVYMKGIGRQYLRLNGNDTIRNFYYNHNSTTANSTNLTRMEFIGTNRVTGEFKYTAATSNMKPAWYISGNNFFNILNFSTPISELMIGSGSTVTTNDFKPLIGSCFTPVWLHSTSINSQATISQPSGNVTGDWLTMQDMRGIGGATFTATNTIDLGNNAGWTISAVPPQNFYWVSGNGNWNDPTHWALTSGGTPGCAIPSKQDSVFFDVNSFSASGQFCNVNVSAECKNMVWNGVKAGSGMNNSGQITIFGSLWLDSFMNYSHGGTILFSGLGSGHTIKSNGKIITSQLQFYNSQGLQTPVYTLLDDIKTTRYIYPQYGKFISGGYNIECQAFYIQDNNQIVDLTGTQLIRLQYEWRVSTGCTLIMPSNIEMQFFGTNHFYFRSWGSNLNNRKTYGRVTMDNTNTGGTELVFEGQYNRFTQSMNIKYIGNYRIYFNGFHYARWDDSLNINYANTSNSNPYLYFHGTLDTIGTMTVKSTNNVRPRIEFANSHKINGLFELTNIYDLRLWTGSNSSFGSINIQGVCAPRTYVYSTSAGTQVNLNCTGAATASNCIIRDVNISGGGTYTSSNSINGGNVTGWSLNAGDNYYWIGGTGNWNDPTHWSLSSGGTSAGCLPTYVDNVFFDVNSFSAPNQTVVVNVNAQFKNMIWNNVNNPRWQQNSSMECWGSLSVAPNVTIIGSNWFYFRSNQPGNTVKTGSVKMPYVQFLGDNAYTGTWTLLDSLNVINELWFRAGKVISNGNNITAFSIRNDVNTNLITLDFTGTSELKLNYYFQIQPSINLIMDTAKIKWVYNGNTQLFQGGNKVYRDLEFNAPVNTNITMQLEGNNTLNNVTFNVGGWSTINMYNNSTYNDINYFFTNSTTNIPQLYFHGNNTINTMSVNSTGNGGPYITLYQNNTFNNLIASGFGTRLYLGSGRTQTVNSALALGNGSFPVLVQSTTSGSQGTLYKPTGLVCLDYVLLKDVKADGLPNGSGGIQTQYFAGNSSANLGNNTNWNFSSCDAYYWVGGSGNWSDAANHWATTSGGTVFHTDAPGPGDNVFFDANSFTFTGQTVTVDVATAECKNMKWGSAAFTPSLAGSGNIDIYGDLELINGMNQNHTGTWNFKAADTSGRILNAANKSMNNVNFVGGASGIGKWTLQNPLTVANDLNFDNGTLITANKAIVTKNFNSTGSNARSLQLGASTVTINNGSWNPATLTNAALAEGTSNIVITGTTGSFLGNGLTYNNVTFNAITNLSATLTGSNTFNVLTIVKGTDLSVASTSTQTMNNLVANATCAKPINLHSTTAGSSATFAKSGATVNTSFLYIKDMVVGSATFSAAYSTDLGGNTGWTFTSTPTVIDATVGSTYVSCNTNNNGTAFITSIIGGTAPYTYQWSNSLTTDTIKNLIPGTYTVTVSDSAGCYVTKSVDVTNFPANITAVPFTASATNICLGTAVNFTAGSPSQAVASYSWNFGDFTSSTQQNPSKTYSAAGTYPVSLSYLDTNGCPAIARDTVRVSNTQQSVAVTQISCNGAANGAIVITANSGFAPYEYSVNNGTTYASSGSFTGLTPGNYQVKTKDAFGCVSSTQNVTITQPATALSFSVSRVGASCAANTDGSLTINATGGTTPYNYSINNGILFLTSNTFAGLGIGNYNVVVRDANGCLANVQVVNLPVQDNTLPTITCPSNIAVNAVGCDAAVTVPLPTVGDACGIASIVNNFNGAANASGTYQVGVTNVTFTVTDVNGNSRACTMTVTVNGPDVKVLGNGNNIAAGDATPAATDHTDFGSIVATTNMVRTFGIKNNGNTNLTVSGITVAGSSDFTIPGISFPFNIAGGATYNLNVTYAPGTVGADTATITVNTNDCDQPAYSFAVAGAATCTAPAFTSCPSNMNVNTTAAGCTNTVTYTAAASGAPAATLTYVLSGATTGSGNGTGSGLTFNKGVTNVTIYATNLCATDSCKFTVTMNDVTAPNALAKNDTVYLDANGAASITVADINNGSTDNCGIATMTLNNANFDCEDIGTGGTPITPSYLGTVSQATNAYGAGFNPNTNEFLYPQWAGNTVYKYNAATHASTGSFNMPTNEIMQIWMDKSTNDYFTANWGNYVIRRTSPAGSVLWSYNMGNYAGGVATDNQYVYGIGSGNSQIVKLNKATGALVSTISLPGSLSIQGGLVYANGFFYIGGYANGWSSRPYDWSSIHIINATTGAYVSSVATATPTYYSMAFDGENIWVSDYSSTIYGYKISNGNAYAGAGGNNAVVLTVKDTANNTDTAWAYVTVLDTTKPTVACPSNITAYATSNNCGVAVNYSVTSSDNCPTGMEVYYSKPSGSVFAVGNTVVKVAAKDKSNNVSDTCSFTVTVLDTTKPVITCTSITVRTDSNQCTATVNVPAPAVVDNCGSSGAPFASSSANLMLWLDASRFNASNGASLNGVLTDASGYGRSVLTDATFETAGFNGKPALRHNNNRTYLNSPFQTNNNSYIFMAVEVLNTPVSWSSILSHHDRDMGLSIEANGGSGTNVYHFQTGNDNSNVNQTVSFNTPYIMVAKIENGNQRSFTLYRNNGGTLQSLGTTTNSSYNVQIGSNHFYIGKSDANEYANMRIGELIYFQNSLPASENDIVNYMFNKWFTGSTSGNIALVNSRTGTSNASGNYAIGTHTITWTATDSSGNSSTCTQTVTVEDRQKPKVITKNDTLYLNANGTATLTVADVNNGSSDNCGIDTMYLGKYTFGCAEIGGGTGGSIAATPSYIGSVSQNTHSLGGGYNPNTNEYWYPQWSGNTVYKYNPATHTQTGSFSAPYSAMLQLWIDKSSTDYYIAGYSNSRVYRVTTSGSTVWSYALSSAAGVTTDNQYVYARTITSNQIVKLNKATGALVQTFTLPGNLDGYSNLTYANGNLYVGGYAYGWSTVPNTGAAVHILNANTGAYISSFSTAVDTRSAMVFDGETMWIGENTIHGYKISTGNAYNNTGTGNSVALIVKDIHGNIDTAYAGITVLDTVKPVVTCPANVVVTVAQGACNATATFSATASDNCTSSPVLTYSHASGSVFPVGITAVTVYAKDSSNNQSASCTFNVIVQAPEINIVGNGNAISVGDNTPSTTDGTDFGDTNPNVPVTHTFTIENSGTSALNVASINVSGTDASSFSISGISLPASVPANSTATFDVVFNQSALGVRNAVVTVNNADCNEAVYDFAVRGEITCAPASFTACPSDITTDAAAGACNKVVTYTATASGTPAPNYTYTFSGATTGSGSGTGSGATFNVGTTTVTITATNPCSAPTCTFNVTVEDNEAPVANCNNLTVQLDAAGNASITAAQLNNGSSDNCGIASVTASPVDFTCANVGNNNVTLTVTDIHGNVSTCTSVVTVQDNVAPIAVAQNLTVQLNATGTASITAAQIDNGSSDACGIASISVSPNTFDCSNVGANTVTLTVTDNNNNVSTANAVVTVQDNVAPVALCKNITVQLDANGTASITSAQVDNGSNDACGIASLTVSPYTFDCANVGANNVTLTVTDNNGNVSTCNATVTIQDNVAPTAICQNLTVYLNPDPVFITPAEINNGSFDACGVASIAFQSIAAGNLLMNGGFNMSAGMWTIQNVDGNGGYRATGGNPGGYFILNGNGSNATDPSITQTITGLVPGQPYTISGSYRNHYGCCGAFIGQTAFGVDVNGVQQVALPNPSFAWTPFYVPFTATGTSATIRLRGEINGSDADIDVDNLAVVYSGAVTANSALYNCSNIGDNSITLLVTDMNGNVSSCTATVTVRDTIPPVVYTQDITVQLDETGSVMISPMDVNNWSTDACDIESMSVSPNTFSCANVGANIVTLTVTDKNGNSSTGTATVTVEDNVAPAAIAQNITAQLDATGNVAITAAQVNNGSNDACGIQSMTVSPNAFTCANVGANTVTLTVTDNNNNVSTATATVTVEDNVAPVALSQNITVQLDATGNVGITAAQVNNGSNDACGIQSLSVSPNAFTCANVGDNTVTLTVTDNNNNVSTATATVTVQDNVAPVAIAQNITAQLDATGNVAITAAQVNNGSNDACGIQSMTVSPNAFTCANVGDNTVTLTVTDNNNNVSTASATVTVQDNVAPVALAQNITVQLDAAGNVGITAAQVNNGSNDACGIQSMTVSPNAFTCANVGANTVTLTVTDVNNNVSTATATVTVQDNVAPVAIAQNITVQLDATGNVSITAAQVNNGSNDACGIQSMTVSPNTFTCANVGANTVTLTVTDNNNNVSTATATVTVQDNVAPVAIAQNITVQLDATGNVSITAAQVNNGSNDACGIQSMTVSPNAFTCANVGGNTVTLTVTDNNNNVSTATATVTIEDNVAPVAIAQNITVQLDATGNVGITAAQVNNGSNDACGIQSLSVSPNAFTCANVGANTVTLTVTDNNNNVSTATATVTVQDNVAPVALAQNITVQLDATGNVGITAAQVNNGSNDACGIQSMTVSPNAFTCANVGANTVTLTVTDNNNNVSTATAVVTVQDNVAPVITCPANVTASCKTTPAHTGTATATDACGVASITSSDASTYSANPADNTHYDYVITRTWTATDVNGNTSSCAQTITVSEFRPLTAAIGNVSCKGGNNGAVNLAVQGGVVPLSYTWSNGANTEDVASLIVGTYAVTVTDATGCSITDSFTVTEPPLLVAGVIGVSPNPTVSGQTPYTIYRGYGPQSVTLSASATGGTPGYSYSWSPTTGVANPGAAVTSVSPIVTTTYTVTITDTKGCVTTAVRTIYVEDIRSGNNKVKLCHNGNTLSVSLSAVPSHLNHGDQLGTCFEAEGNVSHVSCNGGNNGAINLSVSGGLPPYSYLWSNGATTEGINTLTAGTYTATVTADNGRTTTAGFTVSQPSKLTVALQDIDDVHCYGGNDGELKVTGSGGTPNYSYLWNDGNTNRSRSNLTAGTYSVTITDSKGCTAMDTFVITQPATGVTITGVVTNVNCYGDETGAIDITVTGGTGPYRYDWNDNNNNSGNGRHGHHSCHGWWSNWCGHHYYNNNCSQNTQDISGLEAGTYTVEVTDMRGCKKEVSFTVTEPTEIAITGTTTNVTCNGAGNGGVTISATGGTAPYTYSWSNGSTSQNLANVAAGNYTVTVKDAKNCTKTKTFTITQPTGMSLSASRGHVDCHGDSTGDINLSVSGGTAPYAYVWSNGATTQDIGNLIAGTYNVTVTDNKGCTTTGSYAITQPASALAVTGTKVNVTCNGGNNGEIDLSVIGGTAPYYYTWTGTGGCDRYSQDQDDLDAGTYTVTVRDANGCTKTMSFTITEPAALTVTGAKTNTSCGNICNGAINITAAGGTAPYTYKWNNNSTVEDRTGLCAGTYTVMVKDANGCTKNESFTITQGASTISAAIQVNPSPTVSGQAANTIYLGYGAQSVTLSASATGGAGSYTYNWWPTTGLSNPNSATTTASPTSTRTYTVTITDANGCVKSASVTIRVLDVRDGSKIKVCHNGKTTSYNSSAISAHLAHGDKLGSCNEDDDDCGNKGIDEAALVIRELRVYPNPSTGVFFVELPDAVKGGEALILDATGKLVERKVFLPDSKLSFDLHYVAKGTYTVQIANGSDRYIARIVIQE